MLAGPARAGGPEELRQGTGQGPAWCKGVRDWEMPSGPVRSGPGSRGPVLSGDVMLKRPPGRVAVGRAERRGRDQVVKLNRGPDRGSESGSRGET